MVPQRGFEPLTHALRIRRPLPRLISINILRALNAVYVSENLGKPACAGTKMATVNVHSRHEKTRPFMVALATRYVRHAPRAAGCERCYRRKMIASRH